jgi:putative ABC transport system permease protein
VNVARIAFRNLTRQKKRSVLLGGAIAFGVMIITLIGSFTRGITDTAAANFTDILGGQIYVSGTELTESGAQISVVRDQDILEDALATIGTPITGRTLRSRTIAELIFGSKRTTTPIDGVDWADEPDLIEGLSLVSGAVSAGMAVNALVLPEYVANEIGVEAGEAVLLRTSTVTGQQNVAEFVVQAITSGDSMFSFSSAYADRTYLNGVIGLAPAEYQVLNLALEYPTDAAVATERLERYLSSIGRTEAIEESDGIAGMRSRMQGMAALMGGGSLFGSRVETADRWDGTRFSVLDINDMMESVTSVVDVLDTVSFVIFLVLILITMVGLLNTFRMVLIERTTEIGTMRAIGMHRTEVRNIFLSEALFLALAGAVAGLLVSFISGRILSVITFSPDSPIRFLLAGNTFAFPIVPRSIISTFIVITLATLFSAYFPARKAARLDPAVALRATY